MMRSIFILSVFFLIFPVQAAKQSATPNRFGAIAYHRATQSWGVSYDMPRARDASVEALKQCGNRECEVVHKYKNGCAALADGPKALAPSSGATRAEAETKVLKRCSTLNKGASCNLIAWACTR
jgi:competence protein ComGC